MAHADRNIKIDRLLFLIAIVVLAIFMVIKFPLKTANSPRYTDLNIPRYCEEMFGADATASLIKEFEEHHPELRVSLADAAQADIIFFDEGWLGRLTREGALLSLAPYVQSEGGAGQWAIPLLSFMDLLCYNIGILEAAGFDRPPKTRAEFLACARAVSRHEDSADVYGAALGLSPDDPLAMRRDIYSWIWAAGGEIRPPEAEGQTPELSKAALDVIVFFRQLDSEGLLAPGTFAASGAQRIEEFIGGKIAMLTISAEELPLLERRMGDSAFGITAIPAAASHGRNRVGLTSLYAGISAECASPDDAWAFLAFLAGKGPSLAAGLRAVPGHSPSAFSGIDIYVNDYSMEDALYSKAWDIFEASEVVEGFPGHPAEAELDRFVRQMLVD